MSLTELIILGLATWRLTSLLIYEEGPYYVFVHFRYLLGINGPVLNFKADTPQWRIELAKLFLCLWCLSISIGLFLGYLGYFWDRVGILIALPLALSAITVLYDKIVRD